MAATARSTHAGLDHHPAFRAVPFLSHPRRGGARDRRCHAHAQASPLCATAPPSSSVPPRPAHELRGVDRRGPVGRCRSRPRARRAPVEADERLRHRLRRGGRRRARAASVAATAGLLAASSHGWIRARSWTSRETEARARTGEPALLMDDVSFSVRPRARAAPACAGVALAQRRPARSRCCAARSGCGKTTAHPPRQRPRARTTTRAARKPTPCAWAGSTRPHAAAARHRAPRRDAVFQNPKVPVLQRRRPRRARLRLREPGGSIPPRSSGAVVRRIHVRLDLEPLLMARSLFDLSRRAEAARRLRQRRRRHRATARRARRAVVQPRLRTIARLRAAIARWKEQGTAVLVAEHRRHYLDGLADQVIYLYEGCVAHRWSGEEFAVSTTPSACGSVCGRAASPSTRSGSPRARGARAPFCAAPATRPPIRRRASCRSPKRPPIRSKKPDSGIPERHIRARPRRAVARMPLAETIRLIGPCGAGKSTFAEAGCSTDAAAW